MYSIKRMGIALALAGVILAVPNVVKAAGNHQILSHGTLVIKNPDNDQYIEFYSEDIRYLQNELDKLFAELPGNYQPSRAAVSYNTTPNQSGTPLSDYIEEDEAVVSE